MTNTPATQPATLTQYFQHLLEKEENREKFNRYNYNPEIQSVEPTIINKIVESCFGEFTVVRFWHFDDMRKREIIRIALKSLDEFQVLNNEYRIMKNELLHDTISGDEQPYTERVLDTMPKTLVQKYGQMLYDKSIEEIDEIFKEENIII